MTEPSIFSNYRMPKILFLQELDLLNQINGCLTHDISDDAHAVK